MSDDPVAPVEPTTPDPAAPEAGKKDSVSYETHRKLLDEKKKNDQKLKEYEAAEKKRNEDALLKEGNLKQLLDDQKKEADELRGKLSAVEQRDRDAKKLSAVIRGLGAAVEDKWYGLISQHIDEVVVDEAGQVDPGSVAKIVEGLKKTWPEMVKKPAPGMPNGTPNGSTNISRVEWEKLPYKEMRKWKPDQIL